MIHMEGGEEDHYDDTLTTGDETETKDDQHKNETSSDPGNKTAGSTKVADTKTRAKPPPIPPKPQVQHKQDTLDAKALPVNTQMVSTAGWYYFDGGKFSIQGPETVYVPGSDYCDVLNAKDDSETESDSSNESDSGSEHSNGDLQVRSKLSGLKTLNINIRLNVADLVHASTASRRQGHKTTHHKTVRRVQPRHYEIPELTNDEPTDSGNEPVENSMKSNVLEKDDVFVPPPQLPPKSFMSVKQSNASQTVKTDFKVEDQADNQEETYEFMSSAELGAINKDRNVKRHSSEPALSCMHAHSSDDIYNRDDYYSQISTIDQSGYDVDSPDAQLKTEVEDLSGTQKWFYDYKEYHRAETDLSKSEKPDGSFAVISENLEENHHFPFTLLLKFRGKVTRTPIRRTVDYRRKKYELFNTKKDTILKLVEYFRHKPLPHFKLSLR